MCQEALAKSSNKHELNSVEQVQASTTIAESNNIMDSQIEPSPPRRSGKLKPKDASAKPHHN